MHKAFLADVAPCLCGINALQVFEWGARRKIFDSAVRASTDNILGRIGFGEVCGVHGRQALYLLDELEGKK